MSINIEKILAASPVTIRGQPTHLSCDNKGERIAYAVCFLLAKRTSRHLYKCSNLHLANTFCILLVREVHLPPLA